MTAIVCVSRSWGIGRDGALLFRISADHKRFRIWWQTRMQAWSCCCPGILSWNKWC